MKDIYLVLSIIVLIILMTLLLFAPSLRHKHHHHHHHHHHKEHRKSIQRIQHPPINVSAENEGDDDDSNENLLKQPQKLVCYDFTKQSLNSREKGYIGNKTDEESLAAFYIPANDGVPEDFPVKPLGECPYSKPLSHDIPLANVPLCLANDSDFNMRINIP
jgi:hypothetical protein